MPPEPRTACQRQSGNPHGAGTSRCTGRVMDTFFGLRTLSAAPGWISRTDPRVDESEAFRESGRTYVLVKGGAVAMSSCQRALLLGVADPLVG